jgi:hypothetical protein
MTVVSGRKKSSAVSVSTLPGAGRRESAPSLPLGLPVVRKNGVAHSGVVRQAIKANVVPISLPRENTILRGVSIAIKKFFNVFIFSPSI